MITSNSPTNKFLKKGIETFGLLAKFLSGQALIQLLNLIAGIAVIWFLPVIDYALYVFVMVLITAAPIIINAGMSQSIITLGSKRQFPEYFGSLEFSAIKLSFKRFWYVALAIVLLSMYMTFTNTAWSFKESVSMTILAVFTSWVQNKVSLLQAFLQIQQDQRRLFYCGLAGVIARLILLVPLYVAPTALIALVGNCANILFIYFLARRYVTKIAVEAHEENLEVTESIVGFIRPLFFVVIYFAVQGQVSLFILGSQGYTVYLAEVGALSRFLQIIGILIVLNPFFVQPLFSKVDDVRIFVKYLCFLCGILATFCILTLASAFNFPDIYLLVLGENYMHLRAEMPIAVTYALISLLGATLYTVVIARGNTNNQYIAVIAGVVAQIVFLLLNGVHDTIDALYFNVLPPLLYLIVQACILGLIIYKWTLEECVEDMSKTTLD